MEWLIGSVLFVLLISIIINLYDYIQYKDYYRKTNEKIEEIFNKK